MIFSESGEGAFGFEISGNNVRPLNFNGQAVNGYNWGTLGADNPWVTYTRVSNSWSNGGYPCSDSWWAVNWDEYAWSGHAGYIVVGGVYIKFADQGPWIYLY